MKIRFTLPIPFRDRLRILIYGGMFVAVDYKGQKKPLHIEAAPVDLRGIKRSDNDNT